MMKRTVQLLSLWLIGGVYVCIIVVFVSWCYGVVDGTQVCHFFCCLWCTPTTMVAHCLHLCMFADCTHSITFLILCIRAHILYVPTGSGGVREVVGELRQACGAGDRGRQTAPDARRRHRRHRRDQRLCAWYVQSCSYNATVLFVRLIMLSAGGNYVAFCGNNERTPYSMLMTHIHLLLHGA